MIAVVLLYLHGADHLLHALEELHRVFLKHLLQAQKLN